MNTALLYITRQVDCDSDEFCPFGVKHQITVTVFSLIYALRSTDPSIKTGNGSSLLLQDNTRRGCTTGVRTIKALRSVGALQK